MGIKINCEWVMLNADPVAGAAVISGAAHIYAAAYAANIREKVTPLNARDNANRAVQDFLVNTEFAEIPT